METSFKMEVKKTLRKYCMGKDSEQARTKVCEACNISESGLKRWLSLNDTNSPQTELLPLICDALDITLYDLYNLPNPVNNITSDEAKLLEEYRKQTDMQKAVRNVLGIKD